MAVLKNLELLNLWPLFGPKLTDATLRTLRETNLLHALWLASGDRDGAPPKSSDEIAYLDLRGTAVTDAGLKELADLKNLTGLFLVGTRITDAGLKELANHKNLTQLDVRHFRAGPNVTDAGVGELQKALPKCVIQHGTYDGGE